MPDNNERLATTALAIYNVLGEALRQDQNDVRYFISFGTLLWYIRDMPMKIPLEQDIDISLVYGDLPREQVIQRFDDNGYGLSNELLDNYSRRPLHMSFSPKKSKTADLYPVDVDIFFWVLGHDYAWHTYDMFNRGQAILDEYTFKGIPRELFDAPTIKYPFVEIAPDLCFPSKYGSLLDEWYPPQTDAQGNLIANTGWNKRVKNYGQSKASAMKTIRSCKGMMEVLG
jgi:hypothetical protein